MVLSGFEFCGHDRDSYHNLRSEDRLILIWRQGISVSSTSSMIRSSPKALPTLKLSPTSTSSKSPLSGTSLINYCLISWISRRSILPNVETASLLPLLSYMVASNSRGGALACGSVAFRLMLVITNNFMVLPFSIVLNDSEFSLPTKVYLTLDS